MFVQCAIIGAFRYVEVVWGGGGNHTVFNLIGERRFDVAPLGTYPLLRRSRNSRPNKWEEINSLPYSKENLISFCTQ